MDKLTRLRQVCPDAKKYLDIWNKINALFNLNDDSERLKFIRPRLGEEPAQFLDRISRVTYTPILPDTVRDLIKKVRTGEVIVTGSGYGDWHDGFNWNLLASDIARDVVTYGRAVIMIDPATGPACINPTQCLNYGKDSDGNDWFVVRSEGSINFSPLDEPKIFEQFTLLTRETITKYTVIDGKVDEESYSHGLANTPMLIVQAPDELFTAGAAVYKAIQHFRLENVVNEAASMLYIQRTLTPPKVVEDDLEDTYQIESSNEHIILGDFRFNEANGSSISAGLSALQDIRDDIRAIISLGSLVNNTGLSQSGVARRYDYHDYSLTVSELGAYVLKVLNRLSERLNECYSNIGSLEFSGLNTFQVDNLEYFIAVADSLLPHVDRLDQSALSTWYEKINNHLKR